MKKLLSLLSLLGLIAFAAMPVHAQEEEAVALDEEPIVAEVEDVVDEAEDVVAEAENAVVEAEEVIDELDYEMGEEVAEEEATLEGEYDLDEFDFNSIFEDEEVQNALAEAGLTNEEAAWLFGGVFGLLLGLGVLLLPLAIIGLILWILGIIALWKAFNRAWESGWKAIIPIYNTYIMYKLASMKSWFWYSLLIAIVLGVVASCLQDYKEIIIDVSWAICGIISVIASFKFARKYGWGVFASILFVLFNPICILILGFGNYPYEGKSETIVEA